MNSVPAFGRLEKITDLRQYWLNEATDFTPWLAQEENIVLLSDTIGIELEVEAQEKDVGIFRADILCKDHQGNWVLIENQLEPTDHTHLGQLLTYAAGLDAVTVVWVAKHFTEEHRAALDWLNRITDDRFRFFGLEVELWRIGTSEPALKFNIVSQPNDWGKVVKDSVEKGELTEIRRIQLDFWTEFKSYMEQSNSPIRCPRPLPDRKMGFGIGRSGYELSATISTYDIETKSWQGIVRVELAIRRDDGSRIFSELEQQRTDIEEEVGTQLSWWNPTDKVIKSVYIKKYSGIQAKDLPRLLTNDRTVWQEQFAWFKEYLERFHRAFEPRIKNL